MGGGQATPPQQYLLGCCLVGRDIHAPKTLGFPIGDNTGAILKAP